MSTRVKEILGFEPSTFIDKVSENVHIEVDACINSLEIDLLKDSKLKNLSSDELTVPLANLRKRLKKEFNKNLDKFEIYANRNIFVIHDDQSGNAIIPTGNVCMYVCVCVCV